jgi:glycosyltransferase involved in cell wall biosynthesis
MRLLVATDQWSPDAIGGSARVAADTARALVARGHSVTAIVPAHPGRPEYSHDEGVELLRVLRRHGMPGTFADRITTRRAARSLSAQPFDVLVGHQSTVAVGLATALPHVPLALVFHASAVLESRYLQSRSGWRRRAVLRALEPTLARLERRTVSHASRILVLSAFSRELVEQRYPAAAGRIRQARGGVDAIFLAPAADPPAVVRGRYGVPDGAVFLFTARRLEPRMGVEELLTAIASLNGAPVALAIAGDGIQRAALEELTRSLSLTDRVTFLGRVQDRELRALYAAADLFVLPTVAYEGFGMSTVEALASGTPVLGTAVGATPEILAPIDEELIVARAEPDAIADGLRRVIPLLTPELRARCASRARDEYAWESAIVPWEAALIEAATIDEKRVPGNLGG